MLSLFHTTIEGNDRWVFPRLAVERAERRWSALALIVTAQFMVILDVAIVNVALPSIKSDLGFSQASLQWVISAYAIFFGGALLLGGRLGDLLGRRRLFVAGLARVRSELAALRPCLVRSVADRVPRPSGPRRSAARPCRARAADDDIRRRARPEPCARDLRCRRGQRRCRRRVARRRADVVSELALDLLHQRSGRPRRDRAHSCAAAGKPGRARASRTSTSPARQRSPAA